MRKKQVAILLLAFSSLVALAFVERRQPPKSKSLGRTKLQTGGAPEHVVYHHLFRQVVAYQERAAASERQGQSGRAWRSFFKERAALTDEQARILDEIAAECEREVAERDAKAKQIIDDYRARFPAGRVPPGERLPPPPAELQQLQRERNWIILRARDRLRAALGPQAFRQLDDYVKLKIVPNIKPALPGVRPNGPTSTR